MNKIIIFKPHKELSAEQNLQRFIDHARKNYTAFNSEDANLDFSENVWDVTRVFQIKSAARSKVRIRFSNFATSGKEYSNRKDWVPMPEPFLSFAKAYIRHLQQLKNYNSLNRIDRAKKALCLLCEQLKQYDYDVTEVNANILNRSMELARNAGLTKKVLYQIGTSLNDIVSVLNRNLIAKNTIRWKSVAKKPEDTNSKVGTDYDAERSKKLPSIEITDALAFIHTHSDDPVDLLVTSICALMVCAPIRINEILRLPRDCEVERESNGEMQYGLRCPISKGVGYSIKWIPKTMEEVARKAIQMLRELCSGGYRMAEWYVKHNGKKMYLPSDLESFRGNDFFLVDLPTGYENYSKNISDEFKNEIKATLQKKINKLGWEQEHLFVRWIYFEKYFLNRLPKRFPVADIENNIYWDNMLIVTPLDFFRRYKSCHFMFSSPTAGTINYFLGANKGERRGDLFTKWGFSKPNGDRLKTTSHSFRHLLNTLAQQGGLNQIDIAKWSGRVDVSQNRDYDHMTSRELVEMVRSIDPEHFLVPFKEFQVRTPIKRDEFLRLIVPTAHLTDYGVCIHDFSMNPCVRFLDCVNCSSHVCIKGDEKRNDKIRELLIIQEELLEKQQIAVDEDQFNADRWVNVTRRSVERLRELVAILNDPNVPEGALIRLSKAADYSRLNQVIEQRIEPETLPFSLRRQLTNNRDENVLPETPRQMRLPLEGRNGRG